MGTVFCNVAIVKHGNLIRKLYSREAMGDKHSTGEIPFCALTGGEDGGYENFHEFVDTEHTVEAMLAKQEERRLARRALEALSPVMRRRFLLHHAEKRTAKEIAKMEGVSEYSVKESLKLARKKLEAFWKKFD